jgi:glycylpeptide N-tetradecanoyltransferase
MISREGVAFAFGTITILVASAATMSEAGGDVKEKAEASIGQAEEEREEMDEVGEEDEAQGEEHEGQGTNAKQKKKKKSKAAAKLRKKLGMSSKDDSASPASKTTSTSDQLLTDAEVESMQKVIEKEQGPKAASKADRETLEKLMKVMNLEKSDLLKSQAAKQKQHKAITDHKFWKTQPVTKPNDAPLRSSAEEGPIEPNVPPHQVRKDPYPLPSDFEWATVDIDNEEQLKEVYDLLSSNYVEDIDSTLRFNYSPEFLHWVLKHPGYRKTWHLGVRVTSTRKLVAFISGIPHELRVRQQSYHSTEINFLCVHKKLRTKRLAPVLIKEVTRQCHLTGVFQAIHTAGVVIPTPISCARYYHRTLNAKKLVEIGFSAVPQGMSKELFYARYHVPDKTLVKGLREMQEGDVEQVGKLMRQYMSRFDLAARFTNEEVQHLMLSGKGQGEMKGGKRHKQVTWSYVVEDPESKRITDVVSFYSLPSSVLDNDKHDTLEAAYLFYYATDIPFQDRQTASQEPSTSTLAPSRPSSATSRTPSDSQNLEPWQKSHITSLSPSEQQDEENITNWAQESTQLKAKLKHRLNELVQDIIIIAKQANFDVLNCLTVMDNPLFILDQKFGPGDGFLRFYLFVSLTA